MNISCRGGNNRFKEGWLMKAIIMAGGEGKRLKPITGSTPKPLGAAVRQAGYGAHHSAAAQARHNRYLRSAKIPPGRHKKLLRRGEKLGVKMEYRVEQNALGTAGGVKNCADFYGSEDFLVISGDAACDIDLSKLIAEHQRRSPAATIALCPEPEPLRYGLALCDREGFIRSFIEKPDWRHVVTNLVNTGIYIISPRAMEHVPENEEFDFAKDLFPRLLDEGEKLLGVPCDGYWCDIGTPKSYYECCADALSGKLKIELDGGFEADAPDECSDPECKCMEHADCALRRPRAAYG